MPRARKTVPGSLYMITRRCVFRMYMLKPDAFTINAFLYCLALAAQKTGVEIVLPSMLPNHHHTLVFDPLGHINEFTHYFHWLFSRTLNAHLGKSDSVWSSSKPSRVQLLSTETFVKKLVYAAANPVKDCLVESLDQWPVKGWDHLRTGEPIVAHRPSCFFSDQGDAPEAVTLQLKIPSSWGQRADVLERVRIGIEKHEAAAARRKRAGRRFVGLATILKRDWFDRPHGPENKPKRKINPQFAGRGAQIAKAVREEKEFRSGYSTAVTRWCTHDRIPFPAGTYYLHRFYKVPIVTSDTIISITPPTLATQPIARLIASAGPSPKGASPPSRLSGSCPQPPPTRNRVSSS